MSDASTSPAATPKRGYVQSKGEGLNLKQKLLGVDHPDVGLSNGNLAYVLKGMDRNDEALLYVERAIAIEREKLGAQHPGLAFQYDTRGAILNALGRPAAARQSFQQAVAIWERELGPDDTTLAAALTGIGLSYLNEGNPLNAIEPLWSEPRGSARWPSGRIRLDQARKRISI